MHPIEPNNDPIEILVHMLQSTASTETTIANEVTIKQRQREEITKAFDAGSRRLESVEDFGESFLLTEFQPKFAQDVPNDGGQSRC